MTAPSTLGLMLAIVGTGLAWLRATRWPALPEPVPVAVIVAALGLIGMGTVRRVRFQLGRMRSRR